MPGSAANPVVLDPFRTITEVGWGRFLALEISFRGGFEAYPQVACAPVVNEINSDNPNWASGLKACKGEYMVNGVPIENPTDEQKIVSAREWKGGTWHNLSWGQYAVTMPNLPADMRTDFGEFERRWAGSSFILPTKGTAISPISETVKVPGFTDLLFDEGLDVSLDFDKLEELTGAILCSYHFGNPDTWYLARAYTPGTFLPTLSLIFPMAGITATYKDATYRPIASKLRPDFDGRIFILLQK